MVLDHGRVVETGSHEDLLACKGVYAHLYAVKRTAAGTGQLRVWSCRLWRCIRVDGRFATRYGDTQEPLPVRIPIMQVTIEIPEKLATRLQTRWQDTLPHYVFERLVMEAYRDAMLTTRDVQDLLKLPDRLAVYDLCDKYKIATYTLTDIQRDRATTQRLGL